MRNFKNKVAVIIGGGSGIGAEFVKRCITEKMKIAVADINLQNLNRLKKELNSDTSRLLFLKIDIGKKTDILLLANKVKKKFGQVDLLFNHAGIPGPLGPLWEANYRDIEKTVKVNLIGIMHSLKTFIPIMIKQNTPGHIVNTSSGAGLQLNTDMPCYITTKRAVIALSETLSLDLHAAKAKIQVSVLCPGMVATNFANMLPKIKSSDSESIKNLKKYFVENLRKKGISARQVVDETFAAIRNQRFYILTHLSTQRNNIKKITNNMLAGKNPVDLFKKSHQ